MADSIPEEERNTKKVLIGLLDEIDQKLQMGRVLREEARQALRTAPPRRAPSPLPAPPARTKSEAKSCAESPYCKVAAAVAGLALALVLSRVI